MALSPPLGVLAPMTKAAVPGVRGCCVFEDSRAIVTFSCSSGAPRHYPRRGQVFTTCTSSTAPDTISLPAMISCQALGMAATIPREVLPIPTRAWRSHSTPRLVPPPRAAIGSHMRQKSGYFIDPRLVRYHSIILAADAMDWPRLTMLLSVDMIMHSHDPQASC